MVDVLTTLGVGIVATFVPLFLGLILPRMIWSGRRQGVGMALWLTAIAAGVIFWFFLDVMLDAAQLDVNQGLGNGLGDYTHAILALMFAVGLGLLFSFEKRFSKPQSANMEVSRTTPLGSLTGPGFTFAIAAVAALGIGFHALAEGIDIGSTLPEASSVIDAIGGTLPGVAYVLHKGLEGFVIGVFALLAAATSPRKIAVLGLLSGIPTLVGFFTGILAPVDPAYFFAAGGAGAIYVELKLIPIIGRSGRLYASILPLLLGFYAMYLAGLFHS